MRKVSEEFDWERAVIMELNSQHQSVCYVHKVNLRPVAIMLFDSETRWGQFDSLTRTISISRKLVNEHPWAHVAGVFLHEMAHQFVAEQFKDSGRPHGEIFKEACRRLGVPEQYTKAELDLQISNIDWRSEPRDEASEKILDKVKKLLALANSTNEHEALLAMERVRELYAKHNIEHTKVSSSKSFVHLVITNGKKRMESWEQRTISILTHHFFVQVLTFRQFDPKIGERVSAVEIIGTRENVLMAEYVYHFLLQQVNYLLKTALQNGVRLDRSERTSFRLGVLDGFAHKLENSERTKSDNTSAWPSTALTVIGEALVKFRKDSGLDQYIEGIYPRLGSWNRSSIEIDDVAFAAGHVAGRSISLNKPISSQMGNLGKQISGGSKGRHEFETVLRTE